MKKASSVVIVLVIVAAAVVLAVPTKIWVGSTDLEVEFVVTERLSGDPVPNAVIEIHSEGGFYAEREPRDFKLTTDSDGVATYVCKENMCSGSKGLFIDTFSVPSPEWTVQVAAKGYEPTDSEPIQTLQSPRMAKRTGVRKSKLTVPIALVRASARPSPPPSPSARAR